MTLAGPRAAGRIPAAAALTVFLATVAAPGWAAQCTISGKKIEYTGENCLAGRCAPVNQRISIVGNKILMAYDVSDPTGLVFYLDREVDPNSDSLNEAYKSIPPAGMRGTRETALSSAKFDGSMLQLRVHRQLITRREEVISNYYHDVRIVLPSCGVCEVREFRLWGNAGPRTTSSTYTGYTCRISRLTP